MSEFCCCHHIYLEFIPLLAEIDPDIRAGHRQVRAAAVEAEVLHLVAVLQLQRLEILQFPQIPELDAGVVRGGGQVVAVLREGEGGDLAGVAREVGHVRLLELENR